MQMLFMWKETTAQWNLQHNMWPRFALMCLKKLSGFVLVLRTILESIGTEFSDQELAWVIAECYHGFSAGRGVDPAGGAPGRG
ncbi:palladin-like [Dorcoceras hygrometricum]|uniref:Palladin-like n=1 Tax=Dorcoceras hygrometricum TaxID=472368 RepID=A0A2Z7D2K3_9LAMI|nr:palladin-like [Dorcoceras hygrometricum]